MFSDVDWLVADPFFTSAMFAPPASDLPMLTEGLHAPSFHLAAHEMEGMVEVELEVPRYRSEDIAVTADVDSGIVTVVGKRHDARQGMSSTGTHTSTSVPSFSRSFTMSPRRFDLSKVTSEVMDGVLCIRIPRQPADVAKRQIISSAGAGTTIAIAGTPMPPAGAL